MKKMETPGQFLGENLTKEGNGTLEQQSYKTCDLEKRAMLVLLEHLRKKKIEKVIFLGVWCRFAFLRISFWSTRGWMGQDSQNLNLTEAQQSGQRLIPSL